MVLLLLSSLLFIFTYTSYTNLSFRFIICEIEEIKTQFYRITALYIRNYYIIHYRNFFLRDSKWIFFILYHRYLKFAEPIYSYFVHICNGLMYFNHIRLQRVGFLDSLSSYGSLPNLLVIDLLFSGPSPSLLYHSYGAMTRAILEYKQMSKVE